MNTTMLNSVQLNAFIDGLVDVLDKQPLQKQASVIAHLAILSDELEKQAGSPSELLADPRVAGGIAAPLGAIAQPAAAAPQGRLVINGQALPEVSPATPPEQPGMIDKGVDYVKNLISPPKSQGTLVAGGPDGLRMPLDPGVTPPKDSAVQFGAGIAAGGAPVNQEAAAALENSLATAAQAKRVAQGDAAMAALPAETGPGTPGNIVPGRDAAANKYLSQTAPTQGWSDKIRYGANQAKDYAGKAMQAAGGHIGNNALAYGAAGAAGLGGLLYTALRNRQQGEKRKPWLRNMLVPAVGAGLAGLGIANHEAIGNKLRGLMPQTPQT